MTVFDLLDSIGQVDDALLERAGQRLPSHRRIWLAVASAAACVVLACTGVLLLQYFGHSSETDFITISSRMDDSRLQTTGVSRVPVMDGTNSSASVSSEGKGVTSRDVSEWLEVSEDETPAPVPDDESSAVLVKEQPVAIYYVVDGRIESKTVPALPQPQAVFAVWKTENHIGEDVQMIEASVVYDTRGVTSEYSGVAVVTHPTDGHTIYRLTVTKSLEGYCTPDVRELLLASLEKTMAGLLPETVDDYELTLWQPDEERLWHDEPLNGNGRGEILE